MRQCIKTIQAIIPCVNSKIAQWLVISALLISVVCAAPSTAQSEIATVVLDGRPLFQVSNTETVAAQERADWIEYQLQLAITSREIPKIQIEERNRLPTLLLNGRYLLTVTRRDTLADNLPEQQAKLWANQLRKQLGEAQAKRSFKFLWQSSILVAAVLAVTLVIHWGLSKLWHYLRRKLEALGQRLGNKSTAAVLSSPSLDWLLKLSLLIVRVGLWLGVILWIINRFPLTRRWRYRLTDALITSFTAPLITVGENSYSVADFLILVGLLLGLVLATNLAVNLLRLRILRQMQIERGIQEAIAIVIRYALLTLGTIILLQVWGLDLSSLTILVSALGVGIGFGFQDVVKNLTSGLVLVFERAVQVGDFIQIGHLLGTVEHIGSRSIEIQTLDHISIIVPNYRFLTEEVINWSHRSHISRIHLPVGVAYQSDVNMVRQALLEAARGYPRILSEPPPQVLFKGFGDSALDFELLVWIANPSTQPTVTSDINFRIVAALKHHGIEIPFPQRDLNLRSGSMPISLSPELQKACLKFLNQFIRSNG